MRMATLMAQSGHFLATKAHYQPHSDMRKQIDFWQRKKLWAGFSAGKREIYALLAGRYVEVVASHELNWLRCFGVLLWHFLPVHWQLHKCLVCFDRNVAMAADPFTPPALGRWMDMRGAMRSLTAEQEMAQRRRLDAEPLAP